VLNHPIALASRSPVCLHHLIPVFLRQSEHAYSYPRTTRGGRADEGSRSVEDWNGAELEDAPARAAVIEREEGQMEFGFWAG
jgi:hypothetical protein